MEEVTVPLCVVIGNPLSPNWMLAQEWLHNRPCQRFGLDTTYRQNLPSHQEFATFCPSWYFHSSFSPGGKCHSNPPRERKGIFFIKTVRRDHEDPDVGVSHEAGSNTQTARQAKRVLLRDRGKRQT
jgi:hypothetical protein